MLLSVSRVLTGGWGFQSKIARKTGLTRGAISLLRSGQRGLSLEVAERISAATETKVVLVNGEIRFERIKAVKPKAQSLIRT